MRQWHLTIAVRFNVPADSFKGVLKLESPAGRGFWARFDSYTWWGSTPHQHGSPHCFNSPSTLLP